MHALKNAGIAAVARRADPAVPASIARGDLTPREAEIARLAALGMTNKEIAVTLEISHWTVGTHLRRIYDKTKIHRRSALGMALVARTIAR